MSGAPAVGVGFIGLGQIGAPMATHLIGWPGGLVVLDVRPEATEPFAAGGATVAATPAEVARAVGAGVVSLMVRDDAQVRGVVAGPDGLLSGATPGLVIAVHSTIGVETAVEVAAQASESGVAVIDAPVSGGFMGAHAGTLALMVGGEPDAVERCRAPFETFAGLVSHLGPIGSGTKAKLARNLLHFVAFTAAGEAARLAEAAGIDPAELGRIVRHTDAITGGPGAILIRPTAGPLGPDDGLRPIFTHTRELGTKDLHLARALADELGVDTPLAALAEQGLGAALGVPDDET